jgi:hypothetical protein
MVHRIKSGALLVCDTSKFFSFENHLVKKIGTLEKDIHSHGPTGMSISPDGRWLLYTTVPSVEADLMLVDNLLLDD